MSYNRGMETNEKTTERIALVVPSERRWRPYDIFVFDAVTNDYKMTRQAWTREGAVRKGRRLAGGVV
jgi:hypothetical protein